ncbi:MAG: class I SAM-dependent methyltransferase [Balneolaceae bacterium]|nr:class I SAM-dependent methyltransferase [Balneolaceae bacterium]
MGIGKTAKEEHLNSQPQPQKNMMRSMKLQILRLGSYMKYELDVLKKYSNELKINSIALDLGCGTGRDSFFLSKHFEQVYGYEFSLMILNANKNKIKHNVGNVSFRGIRYRGSRATLEKKFYTIH